MSKVVYYVNDTQFHAGSVAVTISILTQLEAQGHSILARAVRPNGPDLALMPEADVLVVNGEGTFRDEARQWEPGRIERLMFGMAAAKDMGKEVHLINATWCNMLPHWGHILSRLDEVAVREPISAEAIEFDGGVKPGIYLDASYYAPLDWHGPLPDFGGRIVMGHIYPHNFPDLLNENHEVFALWRSHYLPMIPFNAADFDRHPKYSWPEIVKSLANARLYITGQHHGVYAACKARRPFVYCKCNTHKVEGLFEWAGVEIPTVRRAEDVPHCVEWALSNPPEFEKLWDFMEARPQWPGIPS